MNSRRSFPILLACTLAVAPVAAFAADAVTGCVSLGSDQEIVRAGGGQQFLLRDGNDHYRVSFQHGCDSMRTTTRVDIITDDQANRLCPSNTRVKTTRDTCRVDSVEKMSAEEFARLKKRASR